MDKKNNYFITIEGVEGAGKTSVMHVIKNFLEKLKMIISKRILC